MTSIEITGASGAKYFLAHVIGRGGFGVVRYAEDVGGKRFAVKIITASIAATAILSLNNELDNTTGLTDSHLLIPVDYGDVDGQPFIVSPYCPEGDYRNLLSSRREISDAVSDCCQILLGLRALHTRALHRDLKPENVLLDSGTLKISDFGMTKLVDASTRTLSFKGSGTAMYMAPEVWLHHHLSFPVDLYAMGIMLFEALAGQPPFAVTDNIDELKEAHLYSLPPRVRDLNVSVPEWLDGVVSKLLEKDPAKRYPDAASALAALEKGSVSAGLLGAQLVSRAKLVKDRDDARRLAEQQDRAVREDIRRRDQYMETQLIARLNQVVSEVNGHSPDIQIVDTTSRGQCDASYTLNRRSLRLAFFPEEAMDEVEDDAPGLAEVRKAHGVVHAGSLAIFEGGELKEGWNVVLIRKGDDMYGEWHLVESRLSPFTGRRAQTEPLSLDKVSFRESYAHHLGKVMGPIVMTDKPCSPEALEEVLGHLLPSE